MPVGFYCHFLGMHPASLTLTGKRRERTFPPSQMNGAIAQLGERYNGIVEVGGSIPPGSTNTGFDTVPTRYIARGIAGFLFVFRVPGPFHGV